MADNDYWNENDPPMSFIPEGYSYEKRRTFRYETIPYLRTAAHFREFEGKRVLCVGDGGGLDAAEFARFGAKVSVIDASPKAIALTEKTFAEAGLSLAASVVGNARQLPFPNESFDAVYCFGVLHHIRDVEVAIAEAHRVLVPRGQYLGMVYHRDSLLYAYSIIRRGDREGLSPGEAMRAYSERNSGCPWSEAYTREGVEEMLVAFSSVDVRACYPVIDLPDRRKVCFQMEGEDDLGWHLFFLAVK